ncbi:MAG TPA: hypothetical protein VF625_00735 [Longimicrobium sp.]|jgi:UDP-N-acetylmuramyl pentapeptide phosphotransferase/UDP-N-acetylglucosamine-1-phosphate transferase
MTRRNVGRVLLVLLLAASAAGIAFGDDYPGLRWAPYVVLALIAAAFAFVILLDRRMNAEYERAAYAELARMRAAERRT